MTLYFVTAVQYEFNGTEIQDLMAKDVEEN